MSNKIIKFPQQKDKVWEEIELSLRQMAVSHGDNKENTDNLIERLKEYFYSYYQVLKFYPFKFPKTVSEDDRKNISTQVSSCYEDIENQFHTFIKKIILERCVLELELEIAKLQLEDKGEQ